MRRAIILLLLLVLALVPVVAGCAGDGSGPGGDDNNTEPTGPEPGEPVPGEPAGPEFPQGLFGVVFDDANGNGLRDAGEPGLADVPVSNAIACRPTDNAGVYNLPSDNSLLFVTVPGGRASTGPWYAPPSSDNVDFGLKPDPAKGLAGSSGFTFVQMSDLHAGQEQAAALAGLAAELNTLSPAFVIATGDLIVDGNDATMATARGWFDVYEDFTSILTMPVYQAVGNHDVVGIHRTDASAAASAADPGYGKGTFVSRFGPSYYSFDWGRYHCIVLDPNDMENGKEVYRLSAAQMGWLEDDLSCRDQAPLLVFYHEPTTSWANRDAFRELLQGRSASLFCGHLHQGVRLEFAAGAPGVSGGISEQITPAVSGEWWRGPNPDGKPQGYRLVSCPATAADGVESLYVGTGEQRAVDFGLSPLLDGRVDLAASIFGRYGPGGTSASVAGGTATAGGTAAGITSVTCTVDDNQTLPVTLDTSGGRPWAVAQASWDTSPLAEGYHRLTLRAYDAAGPFEEVFQFKRSASGAVTLADLSGHREVFWGHYVPVEAPVLLLLAGPLSAGSVQIPPGMAFLVLKEGSDLLVVVAGEVFSPPLSTVLLGPGAKVIVRVTPVRLTMSQLITTAEWDAYYPLITNYLSFIPPAAREPPDAASITDLVAVWGARWLSADDLALKLD